jgi:hypothetical protein
MRRGGGGAGRGGVHELRLELILVRHLRRTEHPNHYDVLSHELHPLSMVDECSSRGVGSPDIRLVRRHTCWRSKHAPSGVVL